MGTGGQKVKEGWYVRAIKNGQYGVQFIIYTKDRKSTHLGQASVRPTNRVSKMRGAHNKKSEDAQLVVLETIPGFFGDASEIAFGHLARVIVIEQNWNVRQISSIGSRAKILSITVPAEMHYQHS